MSNAIQVKHTYGAITNGYCAVCEKQKLVQCATPFDKLSTDLLPPTLLIETIVITNLQIQQAVDRLVASAQPSKVILFGSYARGDATESSDLDLMVIEPEVGNQFDEMVRLRNVVGSMSVGVDLLVYSDSEAARRSQVPGTALYWAFKEGRVMYDASH